MSFPPLTKSQIDECDIKNWYPKLSKFTYKTVIIPLPQEFVDYLNADSCFVPGFEGKSNNEYDVDSDSDGDTNSVSSQIHIPEFPLLDAAIKEGIEAVGKSAFCKLNWSSPKDASWIAFGNSMQCFTPQDIYILLKASDFINHDLLHAYDYCIDNNKHSQPEFVLALRAFDSGLELKSEFRCFIKQKKIIAISQRDSNFYEYLSSKKIEIQNAIFEFYDKIQQNVLMDYFCIDVCVVGVSVLLIDFNPFCEFTDPLLFEWQDILAKTEFEFKLVERDQERMGSKYAHNKLPIDVFDFFKEQQQGFNDAFFDEMKKNS
jgi:hypothetical protein